MKRILLLGKNGQVGWELQRALAPLGEVVALDFEGNGNLCGDLTNLDGVAQTVRQVAPDIIVNAAAYTAVDKAEAEPDMARCINAEAPAMLAREAAALGAWLVHYSTDYVFDGSGSQPWKETDTTAPLSVYGATKRDGDQAILDSGANAMVFRTSWVYAARGGNFIRTMLRLAADRDQLQVIDDQIGAPTSAELLADVTALALHQALQSCAADASGAGANLRQDARSGSAESRTPSPYSGLYNLVAAGETSWCGYARFVLQHARQKGIALKAGADQVNAIPTSNYPTPARRPLNSRLDTSKLRDTFGLHLPHWQAGVARMLDEIL